MTLLRKSVDLQGFGEYAGEKEFDSSGRWFQLT